LGGSGVNPPPYFTMKDFYFSFGKKQPSQKENIISAALLWMWLKPLMGWVLNIANNNLLKRVDGRTLKIVFDELDIFWLRNSKSKVYEESDIRLIISIFLQATSDSHLTEKELLAIVDFIQRKWVPEVAIEKTFTQTEEVIEARVEATVDQAIQLYKKKYEERPQTPEEFVASTAEIIFHEPDGSEAQALLGGMMQIRNKLVY
jgi:hypothetical protein